MKVDDLIPGNIYRISDNPRLVARVGPTPLEEASRLALYVLGKTENKHRTLGWLAQNKWKPEALIYLGPKLVYGGVDGDNWKAKIEKVHHFIRPNGKRLYIYGEHMKHIILFTKGESVTIV